MHINQIDKSIFIILLGLTLSPHTNAAQYVYDDLNRLIQVIYDSGKIVNYTYDPAGNILNITTIRAHHHQPRLQWANQLPPLRRS